MQTKRVCGNIGILHCYIREENTITWKCNNLKYKTENLIIWHIVCCSVVYEQVVSQEPSISAPYDQSFRLIQHKKNV